MAFGLSDQGELALLREYFKNNDVKLGVYNDATDTLSDSETEDNITTEPSGSEYQRQTVQPGEVSITLDSNNNGLIAIDPQTFSVDNSTQNVDAWFLYDADKDEFIMRGEINTSNRSTDYLDLSQINNLRLGGDSLTLN